MQDLIFVFVTLFCFGIAHVYVTACDKLKVKPSND